VRCIPIHKDSNGRLATDREKRRVAFAFSFPAFLFAAAIIIYPMLDVIYLSFKNIKFFGAVNIPDGFTLANYTRVLTSKNFYNALLRSLIYTTLAVGVSFGIGLGLALLINKKGPLQKLFRILVLLAWPIPGVVVSLLFSWIFDGNFGILNSMLRSLGIIRQNIPWLIQTSSAFPSVIVATIWKCYPFFTLMLLAGLQGVPAELYESAQIDGANALQRFHNITFPAIRSVVAIALLQNGLWVFRNYDLISTMTGGGPNRATETLPLLLYNEAFKFSRLGSAAAIGVLGLIVCSLIVILFLPTLKKQFY
jgi:multiple sugar transport system permease protein